MKDETIESGEMEIITEPSSLEKVDITKLVVKSPLLARLIEEVRSDGKVGDNAYNRMHNRHNRSR